MADTDKIVTEYSKAISGIVGLTAALAGKIPYTGATGAVDLGVNNLTVDTNTLFVDSVNHRIGIGTANPTNQLNVVKTDNVQNEVNIKIGAFYLGQTDGYTGVDKGIILGNNLVAGADNYKVAATTSAYGYRAITIDATAGVQFTAYNGATTVGNNINSAYIRMTISNTGNVGIGVTAPTNILSLGNAAARKIWVENTDTDVVGRALTIGAGSTVAGTSVDNVIGGQLILQGGLGTGTGDSSIAFQTGTTLASGKTLQTMATKWRIRGTGTLEAAIATAGLVLKQGANGKCGTFVANGATPVSVSNTSIAITDTIIVSLNTVGGTVGALPAIQTITAATGFTIAGTAGDTSTYNYAIISNVA